MPRPSKWSLSSRFPQQNPARTSLVPHICHTPRQSHTHDTALVKSIEVYSTEMDFEKQEHTAGLELVEHSGGDYLSP